MGGHLKTVRRARWRLAVLGTLAAALVLTGTGLLIYGLTGQQRSHHSAAASPTPTSPEKTVRVPGAVPAVPLPRPSSHKKGVSMGWPHTTAGAIAAAVAHWQDLNVLDDQQARTQLQATASKKAPQLVDAGVSAVRRQREQAGLAPSGTTPAGLSVTTSVDAARPRSLDRAGNVIEIWMVYDRYAQVKEQAADPAPLKGALTSTVLTWEDGDWKQTRFPRWAYQYRPRSYDPHSPYALADGWREVRHD